MSKEESKEQSYNGDITKPEMREKIRQKLENKAKNKNNLRIRFLKNNISYYSTVFASYFFCFEGTQAFIFFFVFHFKKCFF